MEINKPDHSSDKVKNKRGFIYAAVLVVLFLAILGIVQCGDSSAYTFNPEKYNKIGLSIAGGVIALGVGVYFLFFKKRK